MTNIKIPRKREEEKIWFIRWYESWNTSAACFRKIRERLCGESYQKKGEGVQIKAHLIHIYLKQYSRMVVVLLVEEFLWEKWSEKWGAGCNQASSSLPSLVHHVPAKILCHIKLSQTMCHNTLVMSNWTKPNLSATFLVHHVQHMLH